MRGARFWLGCRGGLSDVVPSLLGRTWGTENTSFLGPCQRLSDLQGPLESKSNICKLSFLPEDQV